GTLAPRRLDLAGGHQQLSHPVHRRLRHHPRRCAGGLCPVGRLPLPPGPPRDAQRAHPRRHRAVPVRLPPPLPRHTRRLSVPSKLFRAKPPPPSFGNLSGKLYTPPANTFLQATADIYSNTTGTYPVAGPKRASSVPCLISGNWPAGHRTDI